MSTLCEKCGEPLAFRKLDNGKWSPMNPDGSDHWDICKRIALKKAGKKLLVHELRYMTVPLGKMPLIESEVPPWDESIVEDWSWCKGYRTIGVRVQRDYQQP